MHLVSHWLSFNHMLGRWLDYFNPGWTAGTQIDMLNISFLLQFFEMALLLYRSCNKEMHNVQTFVISKGKLILVYQFPIHEQVWYTNRNIIWKMNAFYKCLLCKTCSLFSLFFILWLKLYFYSWQYYFSLLFQQVFKNDLKNLTNDVVALSNKMNDSFKGLNWVLCEKLQDLQEQEEDINGKILSCDWNLRSC